MSNRQITCRVERSPARHVLFEHLECVAKRHEAAAVVRLPLDRARDQEERATGMLRAAETKLAAVDAQEADAIRAWDTAGSSWPPPSPTAEIKKARASAEDALGLARRILSAVQAAVEAARLPAEQATAAANQLAAQSAPLIAAVLVEEAHAATVRLGVARAEVAKAVSIAKSVAFGLAERKFYREAEAIQQFLDATPRPDVVFDAEPYLNLIDRLATDPDATAELG